MIIPHSLKVGIAAGDATTGATANLNTIAQLAVTLGTVYVVLSALTGR